MAKEKDKSKPKVVKMTDAEEKKKALESVFSVIEKEYGTGSIMKLGDANSVDVEVIPTGSLTLDMALGVGGLPRGRVIEIYGPESSGKTTVALHVVAEAQKMGGEAAFIDAEHALDPVYAKKLGVSRVDLSGCLRVLTGVTTDEWLEAYRWVAIRDVLLHTDWPLGEVATKMGYSSVKTFSRAFIERVGIPPSHWRAKYKGND